jgi:hypothetical protein
MRMRRKRERKRETKREKEKSGLHFCQDNTMFIGTL